LEPFFRQKLHTEADSQQWLALSMYCDDSLVQRALCQDGHRIAKGAHARKDDFFVVSQVVWMSDQVQVLVSGLFHGIADRLQIAETIIDDANTCPVHGIKNLLLMSRRQRSS